MRRDVTTPTRRSLTRRSASLVGLITGQIAGYSRRRMLPLSEAKDKLSGLVDEAELTHEIITVTRHGRPAAGIMVADDLESLQETLY